MQHAMNNPETEVKAYREYTRLAVDYAFTHPARELELTKLKVWNLYRSDAEIVPWITTLGTPPQNRLASTTPSGIRLTSRTTRCFLPPSSQFRYGSVADQNG